MVDEPSYEQRVAMQYDALMKRALGNELKDFRRHVKRMRKRFVSFGELGSAESGEGVRGAVEAFEDAGAQEAFELIDPDFHALDYAVVVQDELLHDALSRIDERARNIILLAYWLDMTDREISEATGIARSTVNDIRNKAILKLRKIMEAEGYEANK